MGSWELLSKRGGRRTVVYSRRRRKWKAEAITQSVGLRWETLTLFIALFMVLQRSSHLDGLSVDSHGWPPTVQIWECSQWSMTVIWATGCPSVLLKIKGERAFVLVSVLLPLNVHIILVPASYIKNRFGWLLCVQEVSGLSKSRSAKEVKASRSRGKTCGLGSPQYGRYAVGTFRPQTCWGFSQISWMQELLKYVGFSGKT